MRYSTRTLLVLVATVAVACILLWVAPPIVGVPVQAVAVLLIPAPLVQPPARLLRDRPNLRSSKPLRTFYHSYREGHLSRGRLNSRCP